MKLRDLRTLKDFELDSQDPNLQKMIIDWCRTNKIPVYSGTTGFDPEYPILYWDGTMICQKTRKTVIGTICTVEEFINKFIEQYPTIEIGPYTVTIDSGDEIKVGCQTIPFHTVEAIYLAMKELRN